MDKELKDKGRRKGERMEPRVDGGNGAGKNGKEPKMEKKIVRKLCKANMVFRKLISMEGYDLGIIGSPYDGTLEDAVEVAKKITQQMYAEHPHVSNGESVIRVTDSTGKAKWRISPNFRHVDEIGRPPTTLEKRLIKEGMMETA